MPKSIVALCVVLLLSACGQTGALYLPDRGKPPARHKNAPAKVAPSPAAQPDTAPARDSTATPASNPDDASPAATPPSS
jgi:predicted small lipoprotein YifL